MATEDTLSPLPGNVAVRERLAALSDAGRLHPCLLFEGPGGVGKFEAARWLAAYTNCDTDEGPRPCGTCWSCRRIRDGNHPDVLHVGLDPERKAPIISVAQARQLIGQLVLRPYNARRRFILIDPADAMNPAAANALLKTFEEPPDDTGFILITSQPTALLQTVRSRSQRVRFGPVGEDLLVPWLEARGVEEGRLAARRADGCPKRALSLSEGEGREREEALDAILSALGGSIDGVFRYSQSLTRGDRAAWTRRAALTLGALDELTRDAWLVTAGLPLSRAYHADRGGLVRNGATPSNARGSWRCSA